MNKYRAFCLALILAITVSISFWGARGHGFSSYDDILHVTENHYIQPPSAEKFWYFWRLPFDPTPVRGVPVEGGGISAPYLAIYAPLAFTTWGLLTYVARQGPIPPQVTDLKDLPPLDPGVYHTFNLILHVANTLLVFLLIRKLVQNDWGAAAGALIFGIHPVQVEPVVWVTGMNNLLSAFFALLAVLAYLACLQRERTNWWLYSIGVLTFAAAVLAKPSSAPLPLLVLFLVWAMGKWDKRRLLEMAPWVLISLASFILAKRIIGVSAAAAEVAWYYRPFLVGDALAFYISKVFWPFNLGPDYGRKPAWVIGHWWGYVTPLLPIASLVLLGVLWKVKPQNKPLYRFLWAGLAIFGITLIPSSGIITYYFHLISTVADRYLYFALVGVGLMLGALIGFWLRLEHKPENLRQRTQITVFGLVLLGGFWGWRTMGQVELWSSDPMLWRYVLDRNTRSSTAASILATDATRRGQLDQALVLYEHGLRYEADNWKLLNGAASIHLRQGHAAQAKQYYNAALKAFPNNVDARLRLGMLLAQEGDLQAAVGQFNSGLKVRPDNPDLLAQFGVTAGKLGNPSLGELYLREALKFGFNASVGQLYLGVTLAQQGKLSEAMEQWALSLNGNPNFYETHFNIGVAYIKMGKLADAIDSLKETIRLKPDYAPAYWNLGSVLERQHQYTAAAANYKMAVRLNPKNQNYKKDLARVEKVVAG